MKIFLAGASGFIGQKLVDRLIASEHQLVMVSRNPQHLPEHDQIASIRWDGQSKGEWCNAVKACDAVINLSGESLAGKRWTKNYKARLRRSRVDLTRLIVEAIEDSEVNLLINASAVGYYGHVPDGSVDESHPPSADFLGRLCADWESAAYAATCRVVTFRIGIVLGPDGGALKEMRMPFKLFVGGHLGTGKAWFPWIHHADVIRAIEFALTDDKLSGPANLCSPNPVTMRDFAVALGRHLRRPSWAHPPKWALRLLLGEFANFLVQGQQAMPKSLQQHGFRFEFPHLADALSDLVD